MSVTNGLLYVITKYSHLYLCDMESATCLYSITLSSHVIFATAVNTWTGGLICVNTAGQVVSYQACCLHHYRICRLVINWFYICGVLLILVIKLCVLAKHKLVSVMRKIQI